MKKCKSEFWICILVVMFVFMNVGCNKSTTPDTNSSIAVEQQTSIQIPTNNTVQTIVDPKEDPEFEKNVYRTLHTMKSMYVILMSTSGDLYTNGDIGEETKTKIIDLGNVYYGSYMTLVKVFEEYHKFKNEDSKIALALQLYKTVKDYNTVLDYFNSVTSGIKGVQQWKNL